MVVFIDHNHTYWTKAEPRRSLTSPSSLMKKYIEDVDDKYWKQMEIFNTYAGDGDQEKGKKILKDKWKELDPSSYKERRRYNWKYPIRKVWTILKGFLAEKGYELKHHNRDLKVVDDRWLWKGSVASYRGTGFHNKMEDKFYTDGVVIDPFTGEEFKVHPRRDIEFDNEAYDDLSTLEEGVYPELLVYAMEAMLCGQVDYPIFVGTKARVYDWKTDDEEPKPNAGVSYMKGNLSHLKDNNYNVYAIKMSLYALMLEFAGWEIDKLGIGWTPDYTLENVKWIEVPYMREEAMQLYYDRLDEIRGLY